MDKGDALVFVRRKIRQRVVILIDGKAEVLFLVRIVVDDLVGYGGLRERRVERIVCQGTYPNTLRTIKKCDKQAILL